MPIYYESRPAKLGLSEDELAFYVQVLGDETLRAIAHQLVETVRSNVTIDWTLRRTCAPTSAAGQAGEGDADRPGAGGGLVGGLGGRLRHRELPPEADITPPREYLPAP